MQQNLPGHFALPISTELDQYLGSLEKYEKDVIIWLACQCLEMAVDKFRKKHAQLVPQLENATTDPAGLVNGAKLLEILFHEDCRPGMRTLERWMKDRIIPRYKIGHNVFFDVAKVREKLERKNLIPAIGQ